MEVCKCSFCTNSRMKDGKLTCPYASCVLSSSQIERMLRLLSGHERG